MNDNLKIKLIFIKPRNKYYCCYWINNNKDSHTEKYEELYLYLASFFKDGDLNTRIYNLIYQFKPFILDIINKQVIELGINTDEDVQKIRNSIINKNINSIVKENKTKNKDKDYTKDIDLFYKNNSTRNIRYY